jgi:hypothetical protein
MSAIVGLAVIIAAILAILISIGVFLLLIKLLSMAFVMGFVLTGLIIVGLIAWQAHYYIVGIMLLVLASLVAVSTIVLFTKSSVN